MSYILITGAAGFIASHIIEELIKNENNKVIGIDNFYSGTEENLEYIDSLNKNKNFTFIQSDVRDFESINNIIKEYEVKYIYHLAAIVSVQESIKNPILSNDVNVRGTLNILESARINDVKRIIFSSSAAVYGDEPILPKNEISLTKPISPYGYEKLMGEQYMKLYSELYGLETISLRYFNVYGERQSDTSDYSGVISIFENKFKNNQSVNIYGDGEQYRDFIYVKDIAKANIEAMSIELPDRKSEILCVGTSNKTSINDLFYVLNKKYNKNFTPKYLEVRSGDIKESICDNNKFKKMLKIEQLVKFEEGILKL